MKSYYLTTKCILKVLPEEAIYVAARYPTRITKTLVSLISWIKMEKFRESLLPISSHQYISNFYSTRNAELKSLLQDSHIIARLHFQTQYGFVIKITRFLYIVRRGSNLTQLLTSYVDHRWHVFGVWCSQNRYIFTTLLQKKAMMDEY